MKEIKETLELREMPVDASLHLRAEDDGGSRVISGTAIVFGRSSVPMYEDEGTIIREVIAPEAITRALLDSSDILMTLYHDNDRILARSLNGKGTLMYELTPTGVEFSFEPPNTEDGRTALELVKRGEINGCSFAFGLKEADQRATTKEIGTENGKRAITYTIHSISAIKDFTLCPRPCYRDTKVGLKLRDAEEAIIAAKEGAANEESEEKEESINNNQNNSDMNENGIVAVDEIRSTAGMIRKPKTSLREYLRAHRDQRTIEFVLREEGGSSTSGEGGAASGGSTTPATPAAPANNTLLTSDVANGGLLPVTMMDVIKPLREELIYNKIGVQIPTGCRGNYEWPVVEAVEAQIAGEDVEIDASKIDLSKVATIQQRISVGVSVTREAMFNSEGKVESIIRELLPLAIAEKVNQIICQPTKVTDSCAITGPFVGKTAVKVQKTYKSLNMAKASLLKKGLKSQRMAWIMTESMKAELEATPRDSGSGIMVIENDKLCGLPVYTSQYIGEDQIGLGDFTYQVCGQFGDWYLVVDYYTGAGANKVKFWLNADFGTATLRPDAFELFTTKP